MKELGPPTSFSTGKLEKKAKYDGFIDGNPLPIWSLGNGMGKAVAMVKELFLEKMDKRGITHRV